jgi:hypothetical protein
MRRWTGIVGILLVLGVLAYALYGYIVKWHERTMDAVLEQKRVAWQEEDERLEREISDLKEQLEQKREAVLPEEKLKEVFGEDAEGGPGKQGESDRKEVERKVREFFTYLDGKDYIKAYGLDEGTLEALRRMGARLAEAPPAVSAELKDPFLLTRNIAHFCRVLGKRDLRMVRDVIINESEIAEPVGDLLFKWLLPEEGTAEGQVEGMPSLSTLYEYAGFFLNSVGGRSYLLRRDPRVRILTTYYSVLILHRANQEEINRHGIDIRPHIDSVAEEVWNQRGLVYQEEYLDTLADLRETYAIR